MHFILTRTLEKLHKTNSNVFASFLDWGTFEQHSTSGSLKSKEAGREKDLWVVLSFLSFYGVIFSVSGSLIEESKMSEKGYDRAPWFYVFLRISLPSFCVGNKFRLEQKVWPPGAVRTSAYSVLGVTLNLLLLCVFSGFTRILCLEGIGNAICKWGLKEQWMVCCAYLLPSVPAPLSH